MLPTLGFGTVPDDSQITLVLAAFNGNYLHIMRAWSRVPRGSGNLRSPTRHGAVACLFLLGAGIPLDVFSAGYCGHTELTRSSRPAARAAAGDRGPHGRRRPAESLPAASIRAEPAGRARRARRAGRGHRPLICADRRRRSCLLGRPGCAPIPGPCTSRPPAFCLRRGGRDCSDSRHQRRGRGLEDGRPVGLGRCRGTRWRPRVTWSECGSRLMSATVW